MKFVICLSVLAAFCAAAVSAAPRPASQDLSARGGAAKGLIEDIISGIIGMDVEVLVNQTQATVVGLAKVGQEAGAELEDILASAGDDVRDQAEAILKTAGAELERILEPITKIINQIIALIPGAGKSIIGDLIKALINNLVTKVQAAIVEIFTVIGETIKALFALAHQAGPDVETAIQSLIVRTLLRASEEVAPLFALVAPILNLPPIDQVLIDLINAIFKLDIPAIIKQAQATAAGLQALVVSSGNELVTLLAESGVDAGKELAQLITDINAEATDLIFGPITYYINNILDTYFYYAWYFSCTYVTFCLSWPDLPPADWAQVGEELIVQNLLDLEALVNGIPQRLIDFAVSLGVETAGEIENLANRTLAAARALIEPLLELLKPLLPPAIKRIA